MKVILQKDLHPDVEFYYQVQFQVYKEPYLIWDRTMWEDVLNTCAVFQITVNGKYAGDIILDDKGSERKDIVDFSILPRYQRRGVGKAVIAQVKSMAGKISAVTREQTLEFFLKCGFAVAVTIRDYYAPGVEGFFLVFESD